MKIIETKDLIASDREVYCPTGGFISKRILVESDGMGFSLTHTIIPKGDPQYWHYKHHLEACYCIEGHGELRDMRTGEIFDIKPNTTYVLDKNDPHEFRAITNSVVLICVFNPPLKGKEIHNEDGSYDI